MNSITPKRLKKEYNCVRQRFTSQTQFSFGAKIRLQYGCVFYVHTSYVTIYSDLNEVHVSMNVFDDLL